MVESNVSKLGAARQELDAWLQSNEAKAASLHGGDLQPSDVIVASDVLSDQAIRIQVRCTHSASSLGPCWPCANVMNGQRELPERLWEHTHVSAG